MTTCACLPCFLLQWSSLMNEREVSEMETLVGSLLYSLATYQWLLIDHFLNEWPNGLEIRDQVLQSNFCWRTVEIGFKISGDSLT